MCDNAWDDTNAQVVCRQLGFPTTSATALTLGDVPDGSGPIWLDNVNCVGSEGRLVDCPASSFGSNTCSHSEDAGVQCLSKFSYYIYISIIIPTMYN